MKKMYNTVQQLTKKRLDGKIPVEVLGKGFRYKAMNKN